MNSSEIANVSIAAGSTDAQVVEAGKTYKKRSKTSLFRRRVARGSSKCKSGRRSTKTGQCLPKRKACKTNQTRSAKTGRCHKSRATGKGKHTFFAGGEATLTAGALEEAFQAGLIAGRGF